ncbi:MAG: acyltransferase family protein [Haloferula sp.]
MSGIKYRPDIDGLRAVAVLPVIFYHLGFSAFSGGFVGVDVFFVISGYLITGILVREVDQQKKAGEIILSFYDKRARRILPVFFVVLFVTLVFASCWYFPINFIRYGKSLITSNLFSSNFFFWSESGYFNPNSETKPLLHTWSLGVEEQFYLFFPLFLLGLCALSRRFLVPFLIIGALLSFAGSVYTSYHHADISFYWSPLRAWELLIGSLLAIRAFPRFSFRPSNGLIATVGMGMICYSVFVFDEAVRFPGISALLPAVGAALLIEAGKGGGQTLMGTLLSLPAVVLIGKLSYSLYLWHWPLIVFYRYYVVRPIHLGDHLLILILTFGLSWLTWRFVERPFRAKGFLRRSSTFKLSLAGIMFFCSAGVVILHSQGIPGRFSPEVARIAKFGTDFDQEVIDALASEVVPDMIKEEGSRVSRFALMGDSHAGMYVSEFQRIANRYGESFRSFVIGLHPPILEALSTKPKREEWFSDSFEEVIGDKGIRVVYLAARWTVYLNGAVDRDLKPASPPKLTPLSDEQLTGADQGQFVEEKLRLTVTRLKAAGKLVVLVRDVPEAAFRVPAGLAFIKHKGGDPSMEVVSEEFYLRRNRECNEILDEIGKMEGVFVISPEEALRTENGYRLYANDACLYSDNQHLSLSGARLVSPVLEKSFLEMGDIAGWKAADR